jgi:hypothetical protein
MPDTPPILEYAKTPRRVLTWANAMPVILLAALLIPLEWSCAALSYHTIGEITSAMYYMLIFVNVVPLLVFFASRRLAIIGLLVIATLIVPYQLFLGVRWWRVHREAERIGAQLQSGAPASKYVFRDSGTRPFITFGGPVSQPHSVDYWIGTPSTSHWYDPTLGWCYYAD